MNKASKVICVAAGRENRARVLEFQPNRPGIVFIALLCLLGIALSPTRTDRGAW